MDATATSHQAPKETGNVVYPPFFGRHGVPGLQALFIGFGRPRKLLGIVTARLGRLWQTARPPGEGIGGDEAL